MAGRLGAVCVLLTSCTEPATWPELATPPTPEQRDDGWAVGAASDHGLDPERIAVMEAFLQAGRLGVDAVLVARGGTLVYEGYFASGFGVDDPHHLASGTKGVMSLLIGAAVGRGLIDGPEQPLADFFPEHADLFAAEPEKRAITLGDVLTMTAGLRWDEKDVGDRDQDSFYMRSAPDAARYVLERPLVDAPGSRFLYSGGCTALLAAILRNVTGMQADEFAEAVLFGPLGIAEYRWAHLDDGLVDAEGGLHLRGRDFLKLGQLVLQGGRWNGEELIPASWIAESTRARIRSNYGTRYGYHWWMYALDHSDGSVDPQGVVMASGFGGQKLFVVPAADVVMVTFGCTGEGGWLTGYDCGYAHDAGELALYNYVLKGIDGL
jgi:CubicO group peptidase (beta-lactamase class C family)